ncbi:cyclin-dependent kinase [Aphelenchoides avenae]|nr:cyclin-dependent kinase [Aphelenchus avenae]
MQGPNAPVVFAAKKLDDVTSVYSREYCSLSLKDLIDHKTFMVDKPTQHQKEVLHSFVYQFIGVHVQCEQNGILHRAICPENILIQTTSDEFAADGSTLSTGDKLKLIGFRHSRPLDNGKCTKEQLAAPSTIAERYQAPEVRGRDTKKQNVRSDLYAAGHVIKDLVGGKPERYGKELEELIGSMTAETAEHRPTPLAARGFRYCAFGKEVVR